MNDPNKRIDVNLSSLLSLKAELLRKKTEVDSAKLKQTSESFTPRKFPSKVDTIIEDENNSKSDVPKFVEYEDRLMLEKSKRILEAKSKFYDKMIATGGNLNSDDNCLVMFNQKKQINEIENTDRKDSSCSDLDSEDDKAQNPDEQWVEYTDCFGRTKKCLRKDLEFFKKKDLQIAENVQPRELNQNVPMWMIDTTGIDLNANIKPDVEILSETGTSIISKHDQMKMNWEKKEEENLFKENVHYQDILFDEARQHGVGYFAFSTEAGERDKQRKDLDELRQKTLLAQKERDSIRNQREKIIAERVKAAKNRQRARLGLPPLEDEPEETINETKPLTKEEKKAKKREEKLKKRKELEEMQREDDRKNYVRPWDKRKPGVRITKSSSSDSEDEKEWTYQPRREPMSQEQWNEKQRATRKPEFAPPNAPRDFDINVSNDESSSMMGPPPNRPFSNAQAPDYSNLGFETGSTLYFTTKKTDEVKEFKRKNYSSNLNEEPIINELHEKKSDTNRTRTEIAPPPTFEYYGPTTTKRSKPLPKPNIEDAIAAGLKFLRNQSDKGVSAKSNWSAKADYD